MATRNTIEQRSLFAIITANVSSNSVCKSIFYCEISGSHGGEYEYANIL
jgi:hypothetical protein